MTNNIWALARPEIIEMNAYRSARSESVEGDTWLDANENPWNDTPYNRYPEPQPNSLITLLSSLYCVQSNEILITRGIDEGIDLLVRLFCRAWCDQIMVCPPTYGMYKVAATIQGAGVIEIPLIKANNFSLNIRSMLEQRQQNIKLIFICSPNNPTGNLIAVEDILLLCNTWAKRSMILVDEAYIEFSKGESITQYLHEFSNLIVLRTLSKAYGLAGIRCGVVIAHPMVIQLLRKIIAPYPIPKPIVEIASQQLTANHVKHHIEIMIQERKKLMSFLIQLSFVKKIWNSQANFILFEVADAKRLIKFCLDRGIVLRDRSHEYALCNCIRVTIGTPSENQYLMEVLSCA